MAEEKVKQFISTCQNPDAIKKDIAKALKNYTGLNPNIENYAFMNGSARDLVNLRGTIPVTFKGRTYNIPICIWIMETHPNNPPIIMVTPTPDMALKPSLYVDNLGRVYHPYLRNWSPKSSSLVELIQMVITAFNGNPPVYSIQKSENQTASYPIQSYGTGTAPITTSNLAYPVGSTPSYPPYPTQNAPMNSSSATILPYSPFFIPSQPTTYPTATSQPSYPPYLPPTSQQCWVQSGGTYMLSQRCTPTTTASTTVGNSGTITEEHIRASLMSAIEDKIRRKVMDQMANYRDEIDILLQTQRELTTGKEKIDQIYERMQEEQAEVERNIKRLKETTEQIEKAIEKVSNEKPLDVDQIVVTIAPLYKQLMNAYCEDLAIEDTIYYVGEGLRRGVIDVDVFIKQIRFLSRKQLMAKFLVEKCRAKASLDP